MPIDWARWHDEYDDPNSPLAARLEIVVDETRQAITRAVDGPVRLVSICAGQGRDVVAALDGHPRRDDVSALLVEQNGENVEAARARVAAAGLANVSVLQADGSLADTYASHVPANVVLICGVFGSVANAEIRRAIHLLPRLCAPSATVIWTRYCIPWKGAPDLTPTIREWFRAAGFAELAFRTTDVHGVGANQQITPPATFKPALRLFTFLTWKR
jgi:hypothetical protein